MSDFRIGSGPFFERGIDSVIFKGGESAQGLPNQQLLTPAENPERPQLETLLSQPNIDSYLDETVRPNLPDRDLLLPTRFRQALEGALQSLNTAAQGKLADLGAEGDPTQDHKTLNRAVRLLNEEVGLRDLLQMYRSALYQG